jgi:putative oxygen-independent coproporphyrinogen III oxidase
VAATLQAPPLAVYVHLPWCVRKCPYCDFNSHEPRGAMPQARYVQALLADLEAQLPAVWGRRIESLFIGGGTPSLFSPEALDDLLSGLRARLPLRPDLEITLEANPGTVEHGLFREYRALGINRLSLGIQSFDAQMLARLGRIHDGREARAAIDEARAGGFDNLNLDLMFGLPGQDLEAGLEDLRTAIAQAPEHLSWYQLTIEPNTRFAAQPPSLPDHDGIDTLFLRGQSILRAAGYTRYEVSAYARAGRQCRHNRNYWEFGDYLGLGAGAHGKWTDPERGRITRLVRPRQPEAYLQDPQGGTESVVTPAALPFEFMLNALRLVEGVPARWYAERTGESLDAIAPVLASARADRLLRADPRRLQPTARGLRFLNDLLERFLDTDDTPG